MNFKGVKLTRAFWSLSSDKSHWSLLIEFPLKSGSLTTYQIYRERAR